MQKNIKTNVSRLLNEDEKKLIRFLGAHSIGRTMKRTQHPHVCLKTAEELIPKGVLVMRYNHYIFTDLAWELFDELMNETIDTNKS